MRMKLPPSEPGRGRRLTSRAHSPISNCAISGPLRRRSLGRVFPHIAWVSGRNGFVIPASAGTTATRSLARRGCKSGGGGGRGERVRTRAGGGRVDGWLVGAVGGRGTGGGREDGQVEGEREVAGGRLSVGSSARRWQGGSFRSTPIEEPPARPPPTGHSGGTRALALALRRNQSLGGPSPVSGRPSRPPDGAEGGVCWRGIERTPGDTCSPPATAASARPLLAALSGPLGHHTLVLDVCSACSSRPISPAAVFRAKNLSRRLPSFGFIPSN